MPESRPLPGARRGPSHAPVRGLSILLALVAALSVPARGADTAPAVPAYRQADTVAVLSVRGEIDRLTLRSLERRVAAAQRAGAGAIVIEIDTPGGELPATLDICHLLKTDAPANTVAWINPRAFSAGTIIAVACREIVVAPNAVFGDAAPIQAGPMGITPLPRTERAKVEAPLLEEIVDSARRSHYDENLVQAFVSVGVELWMLENRTTGERIFVDRAEYARVFGEDPPAELTPVAPPDPDADTGRVHPLINTVVPREERGADAESAEQAESFRESLAPVRAPLTAADRGDWTLVMQVVSADRLLTVRSPDALHYGLAADRIANDEELKAFFGATTLVRYDSTWSEGLVRFLTHPLVMGVLIVVFLVCTLIELAAPGLGIFGATAGAALVLLIGAPYLAGMAQWWDILLIGLGIVLVAVELFLIPGVGVAGFAGAVCLLAGLVGTFITSDLGSPAGQSQLVTGLATTLIALFAAGVAAWFISRQIHSLPLLERLILRTEVRDHGGTVVTAAAAVAGAGPERGQVGRAATDLRPAGRAEFDGRLFDVKSVGSFIESGTPVRVVRAGRFVIEVEEHSA